MQPIVDATALDRPGVALVHVGTTMLDADPMATYLAGHLPDARFVSLDDDLADPPAGTDGRHPLPSPERFAAVLGRLGIGDSTPVVAYDTAHGGFAARLVWMLRSIGADAGLLDGGMAGWDGTLQRGPVEVDVVERRPVAWPAERIASADQVAATIRDGGIVIDSRDGARYRGEHEPIDPVAGHVPGAINRPFVDNLDPRRGGPGAFFLTPAELAQRFADLSPATGPDDVIVYCGSGVTACHNALAIEASGRPLPRVYVGSWSGWSADRDRTVAVGDA